MYCTYSLFANHHCHTIWIRKMASENLETGPQKQVFIHLPKIYMAALSKHYALDHGLLITMLDHNINEGYLRAYFGAYGAITLCKIKTCSNSSKDKLAYVRFSTEENADTADWDGPHEINGTVIKVRRVVSVRNNDDQDDEPITVQTKTAPPRRRPMGLCYMLEDPKWLNDDDEQSKPF